MVEPTAPTTEQTQAAAEEEKKEDNAPIIHQDGKKMINMQNAQAKKKLYEVVKALSAMKLCKEDCNPNAILARRVNAGEGERPFIAA